MRSVQLRGTLKRVGTAVRPMSAQVELVLACAVPRRIEVPLLGTQARPRGSLFLDDAAGPAPCPSTFVFRTVATRSASARTGAPDRVDDGFARPLRAGTRFEQEPTPRLENRVHPAAPGRHPSRERIRRPCRHGHSEPSRSTPAPSDPIGRAPMIASLRAVVELEQGLARRKPVPSRVAGRDGLRPRWRSRLPLRYAPRRARVVSCRPCADRETRAAWRRPASRASRSVRGRRLFVDGCRVRGRLPSCGKSTPRAVIAPVPCRTGRRCGCVRRWARRGRRGRDDPVPCRSPPSRCRSTRSVFAPTLAPSAHASASRAAANTSRSYSMGI